MGAGQEGSGLWVSGTCCNLLDETSSHFLDTPLFHRLRKCPVLTNNPGTAKPRLTGTDADCPELVFLHKFEHYEPEYFFPQPDAHDLGIITFDFIFFHYIFDTFL
jgi:hypothetical protein